MEYNAARDIWSGYREAAAAIMAGEPYGAEMMKTVLSAVKLEHEYKEALQCEQ